MRWYCVLCLRASVLKKSTLRLLNAMVTLTPSSLKTRSSGRGRKSGTTLGFPRGSSVYLIFPLIYPLAFPPVAGAKDPYHIVAIGKPDRQDPAFDLAETVEPLFTGTVRRILGNDADGIGEDQLRPGERHAVLCLVILVPAGVPAEPGFRHGPKASTNLAEQPYVRMADLRGLCDPRPYGNGKCGITEPKKRISALQRARSRSQDRSDADDRDKSSREDIYARSPCSPELPQWQRANHPCRFEDT